jgi:tetratricopeptide (TPR) repeat protein
LVWSEKMISSNPRNAWGYTYLGCAYLILDSIKRAETAYKKAREIDPYFTLNLYNLAYTYSKQGFHKEAIQILERILELNKNESFSYYDLGVNYNAMGNKAEARKCFTRFKRIVTDEWIKKFPNDAETYFALSRVTAHLYEMDSSDEMLKKAVKMDSTLHDRCAAVLSLQGKIPEALNELDKALNNGYRNLFWLKSDPDLEILQYDIRFRNLLETYFK